MFFCGGQGVELVWLRGMNLLYLTQRDIFAVALKYRAKTRADTGGCPYGKSAGYRYPKGITFIQLGVTPREIGLDVLCTQDVILGWLYTAPLGHNKAGRRPISFTTQSHS